MNELEKQKIQLGKEYGNSPVDYNHIDDCEHDFIKGFDAAIALDLPVKFDEWKAEECSLKNFVTGTPWFYDGKHWSSKELYQYWIENILKLN